MSGSILSTHWQAKFLEDQKGKEAQEMKEEKPKQLKRSDAKNIAELMKDGLGDDAPKNRK